MRWLTFILLAGAGLTLQVALGPRVALFTARPDWLLVIVVFFAMHATARDAVIGSWLIGFGADLLTLEPLGFLSLTYTAVAIAVLAVREYIFRRRAATQFLVTLVASLGVRTVWVAYSRFFYDPAESIWSSLFLFIGVGSIYTAVWAPIVHRGLLYMGRTLGLPRPRYTYAK